MAEGKPLDTSAPSGRRFLRWAPSANAIASGERGRTPWPRITDRSQRLAGVQQPLGTRRPMTEGVQLDQNLQAIQQALENAGVVAA
jgi:hypothetical protein